MSGFHLLPPPPPGSPSSFSFFLSLEKVGGGRERWQNSRSLEVCPIPALNSAPQLLWFETGRVSVSFCLNHFLSSLRTPLSAHLLSVTLSPPCSAAFLWRVLKKPARGFYQEDNEQKFSLHFTELIIFLQKQIEWSTATSAQGKFHICYVLKVIFLLAFYKCMPGSFLSFYSFKDWPWLHFMLTINSALTIA